MSGGAHPQLAVPLRGHLQLCRCKPFFLFTLDGEFAVCVQTSHSSWMCE